MVETQEEYDKRKKEEKYEAVEKYGNQVTGEKCQETNGKEVGLNEELYGLVKSDTHYGAYYLITGKDKLNCSCPARVECKHLTGIKNGKTTCIRISRPSKK